LPRHNDNKSNLSLESFFHIADNIGQVEVLLLLFLLVWLGEVLLMVLGEVFDGLESR
jgi:hypothetical protein